MRRLRRTGRDYAHAAEPPGVLLREAMPGLHSQQHYGHHCSPLPEPARFPELHRESSRVRSVWSLLHAPWFHLVSRSTPTPDPLRTPVETPTPPPAGVLQRRGRAYIYGAPAIVRAAVLAVVTGGHEQKLAITQPDGLLIGRIGDACRVRQTVVHDCGEQAPPVVSGIREIAGYCVVGRVAVLRDPGQKSADLREPSWPHSRGQTCTG